MIVEHFLTVGALREHVREAGKLHRLGIERVRCHPLRERAADVERLHRHRLAGMLRVPLLDECGVLDVDGEAHPLVDDTLELRVRFVLVFQLLLHEVLRGDNVLEWKRLNERQLGRGDAVLAQLAAGGVPAATSAHRPTPTRRRRGDDAAYPKELPPLVTVGGNSRTAVRSRPIGCVVTKISVFSIAARSFSWPGSDASSLMAAYTAFCFVMRISLSSACRASVAIAVWKVENSARRGYFDHFCTKPDDCRRLHTMGTLQTCF